MRVEELFPPDEHGNHVILPWQSEFLTSNSKYLCAVGGYGSGKTLPACVLGVLLSLAIPGNRGIVLRRSYPKLHDPTERVFLEVLQRASVGFDRYESRDGWPHRIILENGSEVFFRETSDIGKFLGPEYGWFYIDEAVEEPEETFNKLVGRLRLGLAKDHLRGFITSNPPNSPAHDPHWIEQKFGRESGILKVETKEGTTIFQQWRMSTRTNPFVPKGYIQDLLATHTPDEVKRIIDGEYGESFEGRAVYAPPFIHSKHVGEPPTYPISIIRVWDFGFRCPAVTWHQFIICKKNKVHWHTIGEYVPQNIESEDLAKDVLRLSGEWFPDHSPYMFGDGGDTAGAQHNEKGPGPIIRLARPPFSIRFRHRKFPDIDPGLALLRGALKSVCECGYPTYCVHRRCRTVIRMFAGGYHYPKVMPGKPQKEKPYKDSFYDNVADSVRYAGELFYKPAMRDPGFMRDLERESDFETPEESTSNRIAWMGPN